jgi:archaellum component FlaC
MADKYVWNGTGTITHKGIKYKPGAVLPSDIPVATIKKHTKDGTIQKYGFDNVAIDLEKQQTANVQARLNKATAIMEQGSKEIQELRESIDFLKTENESLKVKISDFEKEVQKLKSENELLLKKGGAK